MSTNTESKQERSSNCDIAIVVSVSLIGLIGFALNLMLLIKH